MMKGFASAELPYYYCSEFSISGKFSVREYNKGQLIECRIMSELEKEQMAATQKFSVLPDLWKKLEYAASSKDPFTHVWIIWDVTPTLL